MRVPNRKSITTIKVIVDIHDSAEAVKRRCKKADEYTRAYSDKYSESGFDASVRHDALLHESEGMKVVEEHHMLIFTPYIKANINGSEDVILIEQWSQPHDFNGRFHIDGHIRYRGTQYAFGKFPLPCRDETVTLEVLD